MLDISRDIHSLTDFKKKTSEFVEQLKQTGDPVVLTLNGKATDRSSIDTRLSESPLR